MVQSRLDSSRVVLGLDIAAVVDWKPCAGGGRA